MADMQLNSDRIVLFMKVFIITLPFAIAKEVIENAEGPGDDGL